MCSFTTSSRSPSISKERSWRINQLLEPAEAFVLRKMLEITRQARCHWHQNVVLPLNLKPNILQMANMQSIDKYVDLAYLSYLKYCVLCIFTMFCIFISLHLTIRACTVCQLEIHRQSSILAAARPSEDEFQEYGNEESN